MKLDVLLNKKNTNMPQFMKDKDKLTWNISSNLSQNYNFGCLTCYQTLNGQLTYYNKIESIVY